MKVNRILIVIVDFTYGKVDGATFSFQISQSFKKIGVRSQLSNFHRDYRPTAGRYVEFDPEGLYGEVNSFTYAGSNAISNGDPQGRFAQVIGPAIIWCVRTPACVGRIIGIIIAAPKPPIPAPSTFAGGSDSGSGSGAGEGSDSGGSSSTKDGVGEWNKKPLIRSEQYWLMGHYKWTKCNYRCKVQGEGEEMIAGVESRKIWYASSDTRNDSGFEKGLYCIGALIREHWDCRACKRTGKAYAHEWFNPVGSGAPKLENWAKSKC